MNPRPAPNHSSSRETSGKSDPAEEAVVLARRLLSQSISETSAKEARHMARLAKMIDQTSARQLSFQMTDRLGRSRNSERSARLWRRMLDHFGTISGFSTRDHLLLELGKNWSRVFPNLVMRVVRSRLIAESRDVILPAEEPGLTRFLAQQAAQGTRINLNQLGEAVLGESEARRRLDSAIALLQRDDVTYVSVKISAIFSQINLVAWEDSLETIKIRLRQLYRAAREQGKFVNLDMEAYSDLELTAAAFREVLSEAEFLDYSAGMVLQAYVPDAISLQKEITRWARERCSRGGAPIKIRLVKGANLAMEKAEAELRGWHPAPYPDKHSSDAAFKQMLDFACQPENAAAVRLGVGSHNLFDVALALVLRERRGVRDQIEIEMLQGMAPAQARAVQEKAGGLLLYTPIVTAEERGSALAYLLRRLDENTSAGNFLASLFSLRPGSPAWREQKGLFLAAWKDRRRVSLVPRRDWPSPPPHSGFQNEPDTDWTRPPLRRRLLMTLAPELDPPIAGAAQVEAALAGADAARLRWEETGTEERALLLHSCAERLRQTRFETIALLRKFGKKAPAEADSEVSEAIDFALYYAEIGVTPERTKASARGTILIAPPWNFPFAIPCGGVLAALMAGNTVILKPAPEVTTIGWWLAQLLWEAGVPREVLHFVACPDGDIGRRLIQDSRISGVVLTGAFETAQRFRQWRPSLCLFAETSGKNVLTISAFADREQAVRDLVKSAFGHSGQKCSAVSLGILEAEVYDDPSFRDLLRDATASLPVGPASDARSIVTPLVQPPHSALRRALTQLDEGEQWLLEPRVSPEDPCLWSPGLKLGVQPGSWFHLTECFGPVLGLMRAADLDEAIHFQNAVDYGLTAGFHSLDDREIEDWKNRIEAGNLYINRSTTGAIVQRQPFGGWKCSNIGPGAKAGGPNYVNLFRVLTDDHEDITLDQVEKSYHSAWKNHFSREHDFSGLQCESNHFRYRPVKGVLLRLYRDPPATATATSRALALARICGVPLEISHVGHESDGELAHRLAALSGTIDFLRTCETNLPQPILLEATARHRINWIHAPILGNGRIELTRWHREQSVSETRHRYGNLSSKVL